MIKHYRVLIVLVSAALIFLNALCIFASADEGDFVIENGVLTEYNGPGGNVTIPENVTEIAEGVFKNRTDITSVNVGSKSSSFRQTKIGAHAFEGCTSLTGGIGFSNLYEIGDSAFANCTSLTWCLVYPNKDGLYIGSNAFSGCSSLKYLDISYYSDYCKSFEIFSLAFFGCTALEDVDLNAYPLDTSACKIYDEAFLNCPKLKEIAIPAGTEIGNKALGYVVDSVGTEQRVDGFKIISDKSANGEKYAIDNGFTFEVLGFSPGDVNGDRCVTALDALLILQNAVGKIQLIEIQQTAADVNNDGNITAVDALMTLQKACGPPIREFPTN